ncbi:MAG TPA: 30S ribosomal protein S5 [Candidatus Dojkabacteria bacterium]|nr:30S ribosomal protein S5 [Candidatus Dojkabacteria bacterium]
MAEHFTEKKERSYDKKTVSIRRVAKVTKGGKRLRFSAMVVVGDHNGSVGVALGRGVDTKSAVEKGERIATKKLTRIQLAGDTIPHEVVFKKGAARIILRPARPGTGVIAGSSVRTVLELCGIDNVYGKLMGTSDAIASAYATFEALKSLRNKRVLERMKNMRDRVELKKETDKERKIREEKRRAKKKAEEKESGRDEKRDFRRRDNRNKVSKK